MTNIQTFYDNLAPHYDKLFLDWEGSTHEQGKMLDKLFRENGFGTTARVLDCACGIGTQAIGLAGLGYSVTASDLSCGALEEATVRADKMNVKIDFKQADFCSLEDSFSEVFDIVIAMDNALPHMLSQEALEAAVKSIVSQVTDGGMVVISIRDYDALLCEKPPYSPPYIHATEAGQKVSFQTWHWEGDCYRLVQYIIEDETSLHVSKFECAYRAVRREELTQLFLSCGSSSVMWKFPEETGFYQPIMIAKK